MYRYASLNMSQMHHRAQSSHALCFAKHTERFCKTLQLQVAYMLKVAVWEVERFCKTLQLQVAYMLKVAVWEVERFCKTL